MRLFRLLILVFALCGATIITAPANAQEKVTVRSGGHQGYTRLVFEWADKPAYSLSKEEGRIVFRFAKAGETQLSGYTKDSNITDVKTLSATGEPLQVAVSINKDSRFRDFIVENKLIVDVYDSEKTVDGKVSQPKPEITNPEPKPAAVPEEKAEEKKTPENTHDKADFTKAVAEPAKPAPVEVVEADKVPPPSFDTQMISITGITSFGIAAFERYGRLWILLDTSDPKIVPALSSPQNVQLGALKKLEDFSSGTAYFMDLPEGASVFAEGGGLSWRIFIEPKDKKIAGVAPQQEKTTEGNINLVWPLKNLRQPMTLKDPIAGDIITAIPAGDSVQAAGSARNFVDLDQLQSDIGLAYVAKSDGVEAQVAIDHVSVGKKGGLRVSMRESGASHASDDNEVQKEEAKKEEPKQAQEKRDEPKAATTEEMAKAAVEKPTGNNIYNFSRWEMGGIQALDKNIHVLMVETANKPDETKPEDIITMAKVLAANDRGPEALGMLNIALQKVPELESNAEFLALRGAALALSGKFDEAFTDLTHPSLSAYDDVKFWHTYTLGGLEDWKQAGDVMPKDVSAIQSYPQNIKAQLSLIFAEIALRNGRLEQAKKILDTLKPDLPKLHLSYASSWNYLAGEAARQSGQADKAVGYWEPLVKNGKDDLFRAKAGLSLTKLQIETKKLKPEEAINRLEGLRYAWRGDELETLINYRLGQLYIDNKEYLKGLTVLRNATTLTPGLAVGQDVQNYMTKSFRDIFVKDELAALSPLDAISIYEEFKDLSPPGNEADVYVERLAERLVNADLLGRAASLLEFQVNNRLTGNKKVSVAIRLAAIRLLDGNPEGALRALEIAQASYDKVQKGVIETQASQKPQDVAPQAGDTISPAPASTAPLEKADPEMQRQILLLKARALSMKKKPDEAIAILDTMVPDADVNKLRTDIAWFSGKWEEAAISLNDLIVAEDISPKVPLTDYQRDLVLNRAIALNLSGNRVALANLRERYNPQMKDTTKGQMFEVVTRPRRPDMVGSREAIDSMMSEIDLFKGFLENYKSLNAPKADTVIPAKNESPKPDQSPASQSKPASQATPEKQDAPEQKTPVSETN